MQHFIAFSANRFKQRLRGIEFGAKMIYNESNKAVERPPCLLVIFGDVSKNRVVKFLDGSGRTVTAFGDHKSAPQTISPATYNMA
jgi:hypothetical protein